MNKYLKMNKSKQFLKILSVILVLTLITLSLSSCLNLKLTGSIAEKEQLIENIAKLSGKDLGYNYVTYYLEDYGIKNFDDYKFALIEAYFANYYYKDLPPTYEHAELTASLFIEYFYDHINLSDTKAVTDSLLYCYTSASTDPYAFYRNAEEYQSYVNELQGNSTLVGIGVRVTVTLDEAIYVYAVIKDGGADKAGIRAGDLIIGADGLTIEKDGTDAVMDAIPGEEGTSVTVNVKRADEILNYTIIREQVPDVSVFYSIDDGVGYIQIVEFNGNTAEQFREAMDHMEDENVSGIIFDLRNNPGGLLTAVVDVIDYIAPENLRIASYNATTDGTKIFTSDDGHQMNDIPAVVLCNGNTASAGELFTAAMRDYNNMGIFDISIVGENTFGKGVMQSSIPLNDGSAITLTVAYYNPPCDINYQDVGIKPNVTVPDTEGLEAQLQKAKEELDALKRGEGNNQPNTDQREDGDVNSSI